MALMPRERARCPKCGEWMVAAYRHCDNGWRWSWVCSCGHATGVDRAVARDMERRLGG